MFIRYLIRLDDACPTMSISGWSRMEKLLDHYDIKPMVGVIPHNEDSKLKIDPENNNFWKYVKSLEEKGWTIAMHGYNHVYSSKDGGMNPIWDKSEFAGNSIEIQRDKIKKGIAIMREHGFNPKYFFAPSHTFDENTMIVLKEETDIRIICDTISTRPYKKGDFTFIPQQSGHPIKLPIGGYLTICYHPNTMSDNDFEILGNFLLHNQNKVVSFSQLELGNLKEKNFFDIIISFVYFLYRRLR